MLGTRSGSTLAGDWPGWWSAREADRSHREGTGTHRRTGLASHLVTWVLMCGAVLLLTASSAFAAPLVWVAPSLVRVRPSEGAGSATQLTVYAAKGESESFQIIVRAPASGALSNVNVLAPSLGQAQVTLSREHYVYLASGSGDWASNRNKPQGPGYYPDALIPFVHPTTGQDLTGTYDAVPFSLAANQNQPIWVDLSVPRTMPAGDYPGVFTITSAQGNATVAVTLHVWNFTLPVQPALKTCFMYWPSSDGGEGRGVLQADRELLRNRLNPVSTNTSYERAFMDTEGMQSTSLGFWSGADQSGYIAPAPSVSDILTQKSWHQPDLYFYCYSADEISNPALFPGIKAWARAFHAAGVDQLITMVPVPELYDDGSGTGRSAVDDWVLLPKQYDQYRANVLSVQQKGDKVWSYNCTQQDDYSPKWLLDYAPVNYRLQPGFINQSLGLVGLLYWRVDWWTADPWTANYPWPYLPGEGLLVYPGAQVGLSGQVVPSMRIKFVRDGIDDYDYIQLLKEAGQGTWALNVARTVGPDWSNWTRDISAVENARVQLGNMLDSLGGGGGGGHTLTVTAAANPSSVASGGSTALTASALDSQGHVITSWSWSDGGAGGSFSSPTAQNPTYTAPANPSANNLTVLLTVTATCAGATPATASGSAALTVQGTTTSHTVTTTAAATPTTVASGGTVALTATGACSLGHTGLAWAWSDGGAGGAFSSPTTQNPTYTAPINTSGSPRTVTLTLTTTCKWVAPWVASSATQTITVNASTTAHTLTVTAAATPSTVASGGSATLSATASDSSGHAIAAWSWSDGSAGGAFSPSATLQNPTYTAAANTSGSDRTLTLTVRATCAGATPLTASGSAPLTVQSTTTSHTVTVTASATPATIASGGTTTLNAAGTCSLGHTGLAWQWSDGGAGGAFSPGATVQNPSYTAAANTSGSSRVVTLTLTATCKWVAPWVVSSGSATLTVNSAAMPHTVTVSTSASPTTVLSGGTTALVTTVTDSLGHTITSWSWSDGGTGGTFLPSAAVQNPTYRAAANNSRRNRAVTLRVTANCGGTVATAQTSVTVRTNRGR
jgi:hypothetical protein